MANTVGTRLKEYRIRYGLTQEQAAEALEIAHNTYVRYENDLRSPTAENALKLALFYHVSVSELLNGAPDPNEIKKPSGAGELKDELVKIIMGLSDQDARRVQDFVSGIKAARTK